MGKTMNKKGVAGIILSAMLTIFIIAVVFLIMFKPWESMADKITPQLSGDYQEAATKLKIIMVSVPMGVIALVILWAVIAAAKDSKAPGSL